MTASPGETPEVWTDTPADAESYQDAYEWTPVSPDPLRDQIAKALWLKRFGDLRGWKDAEPNWAISEAAAVMAVVQSALEAKDGQIDVAVGHQRLMERELAATNRELDAANRALAAKDAEIEQLRKQYDDAMQAAFDNGGAARGLEAELEVALEMDQRLSETVIAQDRALAAVRELRELSENATPGPWSVEQDWIDFGVPDNSQTLRAESKHLGSIYLHYSREDNGAFIAAAVNAVRAALAASPNPERRNGMRAIDEDALTAAHVAVEDTLIEFRDRRIGVLGPANGFVVRERDGTPSPVMRLGTREGLRIGIEAYLAAAASSNPEQGRTEQP